MTQPCSTVERARASDDEGNSRQMDVLPQNEIASLKALLLSQHHGSCQSFRSQGQRPMLSRTCNLPIRTCTTAHAACIDHTQLLRLQSLLSTAASISVMASAAACPLSTAFSMPAPKQKSPQAASCAVSALRQGLPKGLAGNAAPQRCTCKGGQQHMSKHVKAG
jgi:hypothetical protein